MQDYKVIPAPRKGLKAKGVKTPEDRFAHALQELINSEAKQGWRFLRAETLPSEERSGFRGKKLVERSVLVFCKDQGSAATPVAPAAVSAGHEPVLVAPERPDSA